MGKIAAVDLQQRHVGDRIASNHRCIILLTVGSGNDHLCRVSCNMVIGDHITIRRNQEPGTESVYLLPIRTRLSSPEKLLEEGIIEVAEWVLPLHLANLRDVDANDRG